MISMIEKTYRVIDIWTKNVIENLTMREVVRTLGVSRGTIRSAVKNDNLIRCRYEVSEMGEISKDKDINHIPERLWNEWEEVRKPINKAIKDSGKMIFISCSNL